VSRALETLPAFSWGDGATLKRNGEVFFDPTEQNKLVCGERLPLDLAV